MKPLRIKIQDEANLKNVPMHVIEKDYALSYVLAGIAKQPALSHSLIFKGGTALSAELVKEANQHWQATLGVLVRELPECETILHETKSLINKLLM